MQIFPPIPVITVVLSFKEPKTNVSTPTGIKIYLYFSELKIS